jgi:membrane protease YdiL (CAAX protease family)
MKKTLFFFIVLISIKASGQTDSASHAKPEIYPDWTLWVPGATHFYDHRIVEGILFSGAEIGGITLGIVYDDQLKTESSSAYSNFPLLLGMQAFNIDKCDWLRNRLEVIKYKHPNFNYDPVGFNELLKEPFKPRNIFTPITGGLIAVAIAELCLGGRNVHQHYRNVEQMYFVNHYIDRDQGLAIYGVASLGASYGAGIAEEYMFRNTMMPIWDYRYGQKKGLIYSSLFFGSMHLGNLLFEKKPDIVASLLQVGEASILGYFLGRDVQKRGYHIGPAVAAHMWYDFTLMLGSFLIDPRNNYLGVDMKFKIQ